MAAPNFTLHQLRIFVAVAHARSLTRAAKLLDQTQPSLSQHIAKLEDGVGQLLFERGRGQFDLTDAGRFLCRRAETILAEVDEAAAGLEAFGKGVRGVLSIGALSSIARNLLPPVQSRMSETFPELEFDVHEVGPGEAIEMLYARRLTVAVVAAGSLAASSLSFVRTDVFHDHYVLATPRGLDLAGVTDSAKQLGPVGWRALNNALQFTFGTQHQLRIEGWYQRFLPHHVVVGRVRSYELALSMVQAGRGVAIVPALSARVGPGVSYDVRLYDIGLQRRDVVALTPSQYRCSEPHASFIAALRDVGGAMALPTVQPIPPFLRADAGATLAAG